MRVFLTGGTGFIGKHLVAALLERGDECVVLSRTARDPWQHPRVRLIRGDPTTAGEWQQQVAATDAVINLAGARLVDPAHRWTDHRKRLLRTSRIEATRQVVTAVRRAPEPRPAALLNASAIGYYGPRGEDIVNESAPAGIDFLGTLAADWEAAACEGETHARVTLLRTGIVLGTDGGALAPQLPIFKLGLGGPWGDGRQWWSWIHVADEVGLILFALDNALAGPMNLTAPNPVRVNQFATALAATLNRPAGLRVPAFALRVALGEAAEALLNTPRVVPERALEAGYRFRFPDLAGALADLL
ncbi:MAG: TIGR01777 family protein [Gemmatimonadales bacterium]|nr:TIGR01777 family protein [Gemmatimonadales bacterium]NIN10809.1 TIGR01777 family protein [Gemmatimonadales bacterium]NIN49452.1 TIGR01777 family protein [Gemmatimonadales bacterium]NIP06916.1 TIGR01777 family protein [Gemmatimonadales bacterium]NIR02852.1 TIGR01777 family protein [Gemmatimonadales bacterium]